MDSKSLKQALTDPAAWPSRPAHVEFLETHISQLFFVGEFVYKVKKPLVLPFLDYGTLARRRAMCDEELRLNRRLAPDTYLRVAPITRDRAGRLTLDGEGEIVEWAIEMRRLPARDMLDAKLERGEIDNELLHALANKLVRFHGEAATGAGVDEHGTFAAIERLVLDNLDELGAHVDSGARTLSTNAHAFLRRAAVAALSELHTLLERRGAEGRIRDGHGDLHAGNICVTPRGIVIYDCIEFSPRFRCSDVAADLAFLAMDLDLRGYRGFSGVLARYYAEASRDADFERLVTFYKPYRALVRAKVSALRASSASGDLRASARLESMRYAQLAASYSLPASLVMTCGLPASGKSWVATAVARPLGAVVVHSDVKRKLLAGMPLDQHEHPGLDAGLYSPGAKERTYAAVLEAARNALVHGRTVVVDATFSSAERRAPFVELAREFDAPFVVAHVVADEDETRRRLESRARDAHEASDADWSVYLRAKASFAAPLELPEVARIDIASGREAQEEVAGRVLDRLIALSAARV